MNFEARACLYIYTRKKIWAYIKFIYRYDACEARFLAHAYFILAYQNMRAVFFFLARQLYTNSCSGGYRVFRTASIVAYKLFWKLAFWRKITENNVKKEPHTGFGKTRLIY